MEQKVRQKVKTRKDEKHKGVVKIESKTKQRLDFIGPKHASIKAA